MKLLLGGCNRDEGDPQWSSSFFPLKKSHPPPETEPPPPVVDNDAIPKCWILPILPRDIVQREIGTANLIILDYLAEQILARIRDNPTHYI